MLAADATMPMAGSARPRVSGDEVLAPEADALEPDVLEFDALEHGGPSSLPQEGVSRLVARIPPSLRGPIIAWEMEDHYVRVHTARGSTLVLLRLGDAILETAPTPGRQVHRSWWVADGAMAHFARPGQIRLSTGASAPVS